LVAAGLALMGVSLVGLAGGHDRALPSEFGETPGIASSSEVGGPRPVAATGGGDGRVGRAESPIANSPPPAGPTSAVRATKSAAAPPEPGRPVALSLPTLHVQAAVAPVVSTGADLAVPSDPAQVGWWMASALAGAGGATVVDGHVDDAATGPGALYRVGLGDLRSGDPVIITTVAGQRFTYRVNAQHVYRKSDGLPAGLFTGTGPPRLVLITCGGPFDSAQKSYLDNVVVYAELTQS